ncbi:hypothetical protein ACFE04_001996 [Oxalis oulophora]
MGLVSEQLESSDQSSASIQIPTEWSEAAEFIAANSVSSSPPPIIIVCGAKNCGKSTFSRLLLNLLLQRYRKVAYLDTDVGQPEFTAPGFLSLTIVDKPTPDFAIPYLKTPERCFFFGDVSSKRDPSAYTKYIYALFNHYKAKYNILNKSENAVNAKLPLVVNTPGWVKGIGYDMLVDILRFIAPTHVVKMKLPTESKNLPAGAFWLDEDNDGEVSLIEVKSAHQVSPNRSVLFQKDAKLLRDLRLMAYFRQCFPSDLNITTIKELAHALASHPPYEVPISTLKTKHLYNKVPDSEVFYCLNATIVGLAVSSDQSEDLPSCVGLGIVRGIDTFKGVLYVITPVPPSTLENVDLLLQGFIQIPACLLQLAARNLMMLKKFPVIPHLTDAGKKLIDRLFLNLA